MARGGFRGAPAFSIPSGHVMSGGVEGEMAYASIASLLGRADPPVVTRPGGVEFHVGVGQHGMIMDVYSSASLSSLTLDFGLATPAPPVDTVSGGDVHVPIAELLKGDDASGGGLLGFAGEQHVPDALHALAAGQSVPGGFETPLWLATPDDVSAMGRLALGHEEMAAFLGNDGVAPISEHHVIA